MRQQSDHDHGANELANINPMQLNDKKLESYAKISVEDDCV